MMLCQRAGDPRRGEDSVGTSIDTKRSRRAVDPNADNDDEHVEKHRPSDKYRSRSSVDPVQTHD
jgi:hypothetical protein